jgi:hypothetical protein
MIQALSETSIGRAILAFWVDMPLWVAGNIGLAISLWLSFRFAPGALPLVLSFPGVFVVAGLANALTQPARTRTPRWTDLLAGPYRVTLSVWVVLLSVAVPLLFHLPAPAFWGLCILAAAILLVAPFVVAIAALYAVGLALAWRNALVLAIRFPVNAVGLLVLALVFGWLILVTRGALVLALPALWLDINIFSTYEMVKKLEVERQ